VFFFVIMDKKRKALLLVIAGRVAIVCASRGGSLLLSGAGLHALDALFGFLQVGRRGEKDHVLIQIGPLVALLEILAQ